MTKKVKDNLRTEYAISLTAGGLLLHETMSVIDFLIESRISDLNEAIDNSNILKTNSLASRTRIITELRRRNKAVRPDIWTWLKENDENEQKITLFYICLKATPILFDFQTEVVLEKWRALDLFIVKEDVLYFFDKKAQFETEIDKWSETTRIKAATVIIRILRESGILRKNKITPMEAPDSFWLFFVKQDDPWFLELCLLPQNRREQILDLYK